MISSEEQILRQENTVRQLISNDRNADIWYKVIVPTDLPDFMEYKVDLKTAIDTALKNRPELEQCDIQLERSDINLKMTENNRKWQMDLNRPIRKQPGPPGPQHIKARDSVRLPEPSRWLGQAYKTYLPKASPTGR